MSCSPSKINDISVHAESPSFYKQDDDSVIHVIKNLEKDEGRQSKQVYFGAKSEKSAARLSTNST